MPKKIWEIWREGYRTVGASSEAGLLADGIEARTFRNACVLHTREDAVFDHFFAWTTADKPTYWGCRLFATEAEARKSFG